MDVRFILVSIPDPKKRLLIARRLGRLPNVGMSQALAMLDRLPATVLGRMAYDESVSLAKDLEAMGCRVRMEPLGPAQTLRASPPPETPVIEEPIEAAPKERAPFRMPVSFPSLDGEAKAAAPVSPQPKLRRRFSSVWIAGVAIALLIAGSLFVASLLSPVKKARRDLSHAEQCIAANPEDTTAVELALSAYAELAQSEKSMAKRIEHLTRAVRLRSDDAVFRSMLARAYADSATRMFNQEMRVRFFQIAISFNKYNESAWDGLIAAYESLGNADLAQDVRMRKMSVFGKPQEGLDQILMTYGDILYSPVMRNDTLFIAYQSRKQKIESISRELHVLSQDLQALHIASKARIEVFAQNKRACTVATSLRFVPDNLSEWKQAAKFK